MYPGFQASDTYPVPRAVDPRLKAHPAPSRPLPPAGFTLPPRSGIALPFQFVTLDPRAQGGRTPSAVPRDSGILRSIGVPLPRLSTHPAIQTFSAPVVAPPPPQQHDESSLVDASRPQTPPIPEVTEDPRLPPPAPDLRDIPNHVLSLKYDVAMNADIKTETSDRGDDTLPGALGGIISGDQTPAVSEDVLMAAVHSPTPERAPTPVQVKAESEDQKPTTEWLHWDPVSRRTETWRPPPIAAESSFIKVEEQPASQPSFPNTSESMATAPTRSLTPEVVDPHHEQIVEDSLPVPSPLVVPIPLSQPIREVETPQRQSKSPARETTPVLAPTRSETPGGVFAQQLKVHVLNPDENKFAIVTLTASHNSLTPLLFCHRADYRSENGRGYDRAFRASSHYRHQRTWSAPGGEARSSFGCTTGYVLAGRRLYRLGHSVYRGRADHSQSRAFSNYLGRHCPDQDRKTYTATSTCRSYASDNDQCHCHCRRPSSR